MVGAVPERLDRVTILLSSGSVVFGWDERTELLRRTSLSGGWSIRQEFETVGASRPVALTSESNNYLLFHVLEDWSLGGAGQEALPPGLIRLRDALHDDLRHAEQRAGDA